jgi:Mg2+/Co2+ transporter CorB
MSFGLIAIIVVIVLLLAVSAFFSSAETALTAASRPRMHALARKGARRARLVNELRDRKERLITAILIGNNLVNILASALATGALIALFGEAGIAYATVAMTVLVVVFGEVLPKTFAINHADRVALAVAPVVRIVIKVLGPAVGITQAVVRCILRILGAHRLQVGAKAAEEELRGAIELHSGDGERDERNMLRSILDLADVEVGTIMVHRRQRPWSSRRWPASTRASRFGAASPTTSSGCCMPRRFSVRCASTAAISTRSASTRSRRRPGSSRNRRPCSISSRHSGGGASISP